MVVTRSRGRHAVDRRAVGRHAAGRHAVGRHAAVVVMRPVVMRPVGRSAGACTCEMGSFELGVGGSMRRIKSLLASRPARRSAHEAAARANATCDGEHAARAAMWKGRPWRVQSHGVRGRSKCDTRQGVRARRSAGAPCTATALDEHVDVHVAGPAPTSCVNLWHKHTAVGKCRAPRFAQHHMRTTGKARAAREQRRQWVRAGRGYEAGAHHRKRPQAARRSSPTQPRHRYLQRTEGEMA